MRHQNNVNDKHNLGMRNARLLHRDLLPEVGCQDFELYKGSSLALFNLGKKKVKVRGKDRVCKIARVCACGGSGCVRG